MDLGEFFCVSRKGNSGKATRDQFERMLYRASPQSVVCSTVLQLERQEGAQLGKFLCRNASTLNLLCSPPALLYSPVQLVLLQEEDVTWAITLYSSQGFPE